MALEFTRSYNVEDLFPFSTVRITVEDSNGNVKGAGTAFFYRFYIDKSYSIDFIVTAKHILEDHKTGKIKGEKTKFSFNICINKRGEKITPDTVIKLKKQDIFIETKDWINLCDSDTNAHPNNFLPENEKNEQRYGNQFFGQEFWHQNPKELDLAFIPVHYVMNKVEILLKERENRETYDIPFYSAVHADKCLHAKFLFSEIGKLHLRDLNIIGYPKEQWDQHNNLPITLSGCMATPYNINSNNKPQFVINGTCISGSSGSPVILFERMSPIPRMNERGELSINTIIPNNSIFLGMMTEARKDEHDRYLNIGDALKSKVIEDTIRAWCIKKHYIDYESAMEYDNYERNLNSMVKLFHAHSTEDNLVKLLEKIHKSGIRYHPFYVFDMLLSSNIFKHTELIFSTKRIGAEEIEKPEEYIEKWKKQNKLISNTKKQISDVVNPFVNSLREILNILIEKIK